MAYFSLDGQSVIGMKSDVNEIVEVAGNWMPSIRRVSFVENGGVGTRMIILSNHEVMK